MQQGPLLITHRGISGPAALKLSAFAAAELRACKYKGDLVLTLIPGLTLNQATVAIREHAAKHGSAQVAKGHTPSICNELPRRVWSSLVQHAGTPDKCRWAEIPKGCIAKLAEGLVFLKLPFSGKDTNKEEFVTAGGVELNEVWLARMESKFTPGLFFGGEMLNVDGITGGFNFQACWTTGHVAGEAAATRVFDINGV